MFEKILSCNRWVRARIEAAKVGLELGKLSGGRVNCLYVADTERDAPSAG